jgi:hypothetical protein
MRRNSQETYRHLNAMRSRDYINISQRLPGDDRSWQTDYSISSPHMCDSSSVTLSPQKQDTASNALTKLRNRVGYIVTLSIRPAAPETLEGLSLALFFVLVHSLTSCSVLIGSICLTERINS